MHADDELIDAQEINRAMAHRMRVERAWSGAMNATDDPIQKVCLADSMAHELNRADAMIRFARGTTRNFE